MSKQLTKAEWVRHGLRTLAEHGPNGLKVGAMATALGVSRGSFYWHFVDIADFKTQVLDAWARGTTDQVRELVANAGDGVDRLSELMRLVFGAGRQLDRSVRAWAASEPPIAVLVADVDVKRAAFVSDLLREAGVAEPAATRRGAFLYWALLGQTFVAAPAQAALADDGMADIADLFRT